MSRRSSKSGTGINLFNATGWLFADLFVALAMAFLVANTVGTIPPPFTHATPTPTPTPMITPTPIPPRALDLKPITITLRVDPAALLTNNPQEIASIEQQVRAVPQLSGRSAGLVLAFGGASGVNPSYGLQVAQKVDTDVLTALGSQGYVFQNTVYREFFNLDLPPSTVSIDVYVFKQ
jgi:hypothetical protein